MICVRKSDNSTSGNPPPRYQTDTYQLIINIRHLVCICTKFGLPDWKNKFWFCFCLGFLFLLFTFYGTIPQIDSN